MRVILQIWRQESKGSTGKFVKYEEDCSPDERLLKVLEDLNNELVRKGEREIAFEADCFEGTCGTCAMMTNGNSGHIVVDKEGKKKAKTTCQVYMRDFKDGGTIVLEPLGNHEVVCDLVADRAKTRDFYLEMESSMPYLGSAPSVNTMLVPKHIAQDVFFSDRCLGCARCIAVCPNQAMSLFAAGKFNCHTMPQTKHLKDAQVIKFVKHLDKHGAGNCSNQRLCEEVCPMEVEGDLIQKMRLAYLIAKAKELVGKKL